MKILKRKLTKEEASKLVTSVKQTQNIMGFTEKEWLEFPYAYVAEVDGKFAGVFAYEDLAGNWSEMTVLFVLDEYRKQGIGRALMEVTYNDLANRKRNIYSTSRNQTVINFFKDKGFQMVPVWKLPKEILLSYPAYVLVPYRLKEFVRKLFAFPGQRQFVYAIKHTYLG